MNKEMLRRSAWIIVGSMVLIGCSSNPSYARRSRDAAVVTPSGDVVVPNPAPPARHEVIPAPPGNGYFWIPSSWIYENQRWIWLPGHWQAPRSRRQGKFAVG